jgi:hypothetical protein
MTVASSTSAKTSITSFAWLPDWSRLPRNAARRSRRRSAHAPVAPSQVVQRVSSVAASRRSDEMARGGTRRHELLARWSPPVAASPDNTSGPRPRGATVTDAPALAPPARARPDPVPSHSRNSELTPLTVRLVPFPDPLRPRWVSSPAGSSAPASRITGETPAYRTHRGDAAEGHHLTWRPPTLATVWTRVSEIVEKEIRRHLLASDAPPAPAAAPSTPGAPRAGPVAAPPVVAITDRLVGQLMTRMRALAREERFRAGHLR